MSHKKIIRAWKDAEYLESLSEAERAMLPAHPAGQIEITDAELAHVAGAYKPGTYPIPSPPSTSIHTTCFPRPPKNTQATTCVPCGPSTAVCWPTNSFVICL
jgi:mersacidin/lichenicidin family type 2 lantibiotic